MKKLISLTMIGLFIAFAANTGCTPSSSGGGTILNLPNLASFAIQAISAFVPGSSASVTISVPNLGAGTFTVNYNLTSSTTPADNMSNLTATLTMVAGATTGTFNTPNIPQGGNVSIIINSISNSSGNSTVTSNNTKSFFDSTGLMTCNINGNSFRATDVKATLTGSGGILSIHGVLWNPLTTITLYWDNYTTGTTGTINFNSGDATALLGSTGYTAPGVASLSAHGSITITSTSPLITGTFSFTCNGSDSTQMTTGTFSAPHP